MLGASGSCWACGTRPDTHASHQRADVSAPDIDALQPQQVAQHATAGERVFQVQFVDAARISASLGLGDRSVVHRPSADAPATRPGAGLVKPDRGRSSLALSNPAFAGASKIVFQRQLSDSSAAPLRPTTGGAQLTVPPNTPAARSMLALPLGDLV